MNDASEHAHQVTLINWFEREYSEHSGRLFAIPNGGYRSMATAKKLKAEGVRKGIPDAFLPIARGGYHGLFIELKTLKGRPSKEQKDWIEYLSEQGYRAEICKGWESAKEVIIDYLG